MSKTLINFAHANGFPAGSYQTLFNYLPENFHVIALDKYGHNEKYPVENNWQLLVNEMISFVLKELAEHNKAQVIAVGHSFGGVISFIAACQRPELFKGVIMIDPPIVTGSTALAMKYVKKTRLIDKFSPSGKSKFRRTCWPLGTDVGKLFESKSLFQNFDKRCLGDYIKHGIVERNKQLELVFSAEVETNIFRTLTENLSSYKNKLTVPTTLIYAEQTNVSPYSYFKKFARLNKKIDLITTQGSHMFPLEKPEETAKLIARIASNF